MPINDRPIVRQVELIVLVRCQSLGCQDFDAVRPSNTYEKESEYDQWISQSYTSDQPTAP